MRRALAAAVIVALLGVWLPARAAKKLNYSPRVGDISKTATAPETHIEAAPETETELPDAEMQEFSGCDAELTVTALINGEHRELNLHEYLIGVTAAEMPASFSDEALKAQAVAARTYTLYKREVEPSAAHDEDVCNDISCCKAYFSDAELMERWGEDYDRYRAKIEAAVSATDGLVLVWEGEPILAVFHSSSGGCTESSEAVWGRALPYLVSVESCETAAEVPNYVSETVFTADEFRERFLAVYPSAILDGEPEGWFSNQSLTGGGRLKSLTVGGITVSGTELRSVFELRSAEISIRTEGENICLTCTGYGHGAGMSQYGAESMAQSGSNFEEILAHYYTGTALTNFKLVI